MNLPGKLSLHLKVFLIIFFFIFFVPELYYLLSDTSFLFQSYLSAHADTGRGRTDARSIKISVTEEELDTLPAIKLLPFLKDTAIKGKVSLKIVITDFFDSSGSFGWQAEAVIKGLIVASERLNIHLRDKSLKLISQGFYNRKNKSVKIESFKASISQFGQLSVRGRVNHILSDIMDMELDIKADSIPIHRIKEIISGTALKWQKEVDINGYANAEVTVKGQTENLQAKGYISLNAERIILKEAEYTIHGKGTVHSTISLTVPEDEEVLISGTSQIDLEQGGFSSPDGTKIGEGIELNISNQFKFPLSLNWIEYLSDAEATGFELLLGKFYGNFRNKRLEFSSRGIYSKINDSINIYDTGIGMNDTVSIRISGTVSRLSDSPAFDTYVEVADLSNRETFNFFIRETFQEQIPLLEHMDISGTSNLQLFARGTKEAFNISGEINVRDMNIAKEGEDKNVRGIQITLPVNLSYPEAGKTGMPGKYGNIKIADFSWSSLRFSDVNIYPALWQNGLILREDVNISVLGGTVSFMDVSFSDILSPDRTLRLAIDIQDIDLGKASVAFGLPEFGGRLTGNIPQAIFSENRLRTEGEIISEVFSGTVTLKGLSAENVFSPIPSLKTSIEFKDINLNELTRTFEFGNISGIIQGTVDNLVIVNGQAQSFRASVETVKRRGVSQQVSVKALRKISILGSGASASVLDRGIYQFFKKYRYDKIGFRALLHNDNLMLKGIDREGNKEYLVKGGLLPPKVDVVTYSQNISFSEIVKRLKRISQAE